MKTQLRKSALMMALAAIAVFGATATASADTNVSIDSFNDLRVVAAAGVANDIDVYPYVYGSSFEIRDPSDVVTPGAGCTSINDHAAYCVGLMDQVIVMAGDGNDEVSGQWVAVPFYANGGSGTDLIYGASWANNILLGDMDNDTIHGGSYKDQIDGGHGDDTINGNDDEDILWGNGGNDILNGGNAVDSLNGGDGADTLNGENGSDGLKGEAGIDVLNGGADEDTLTGGTQADQLNGGAGIDTVSYAEKTTKVWANIDLSASDGTSGEGDKIGLDVENLIGGSGADLLTATTGTTGANNYFRGGPGNDVLTGYAGNDTLDGQGGQDTLDGGAHNDTLLLRDGVSDFTTKCGTGTDIVTADLLPKDPVNGDCETVNRG